MMYRLAFVIVCCILLFSCKEEAIPKPKAMLRLDYPTPAYQNYTSAKFKFNKNKEAKIKSENKDGLVLDYPKMKGSVYLTYKQVNNNINQLLTDAQKLSYEHVVKADNIIEQPFINTEKGVYGMFYEVTGNAASQSQFYVTDSVNHFVTGSLYFYAKPNYDSIYPAAIYLQQDIRTIMESLDWN
ncbi:MULTISPECIES: gliding motility lipoprotein GldD [Flavobacteriaceae]|uniref:gliding motility lipoprotein GldD n=1 Tax=Flavobacteriaceae TaxID=49546 RepID=UPI0010ADCC40|nr:MULTISPECIES: gliding motility lipoprotein GldD [Flavobacteriaceae]NJB36833.1 gliding motility lipoprotein GldD [Croceivirga sp. JEA036]TKD65353.1 gliding motility lipoprotein GldD [Flavobacterium sp. ASW18X]